MGGLAILGSLQTVVVLIITITAFVFEIAALIDSFLYRADAYKAAGKLTKPAWNAILGAAVLIQFLALPPLSISPIFLTILGFVATCVYFLDVRKAVRSVDPKYRNR